MDQQIEIIRSQSGGVLKGNPDAVHDMRVASRRFHVALCTFEPYLTPESATLLREDAQNIYKSLGRGREIDVMVSLLEGMRKEVDDPWRRSVDHAITTLCYYRNAEEGACIHAAERPLSDAFDTAHKVLYDMAPESNSCARKLARTTLEKQYKKVRKAFRAWRDVGEDENELHTVRIDLKKFRYAAEHFRTLYPKPMDTFIESVHQLQSKLGQWNDFRQLRDELTRIESDAPYREAQGFPLIIQAYDRHAAIALKEVLRSGTALFKQEERKIALKLLRNPGGKCCD